MNILILGATGRVGHEILNRALNDGHDVTILVRDKEKVTSNHKQLNTIQGNVLNKSDIEQAVRGNKAVISALSTDGDTTLTEAMPIIIEAMEQEGIQRIVTIGTAGILQSRTDHNLLRYQSNESKRKTTRAAEEHHKVYELLNKSSLNWTIVCPTYLPDGERVGEYRVEQHYLPEDAVKISVPDTADFAYSQLSSNKYNQSRVGIAY
ncbi:NAD(P)-dependent oxidoreductase [Mammaliicoccus vitulinus]|uniref:NAD(P)-dependent oxidoreductase n=1 Tax=Mammaliicoccus vitulinus TaxID=71237 RepID=UPI001ADF31D2|nr:SDR family oxidoreductase [Mammaliicoccus vitulinus]QTN10975.1 SDR family oxidoreductase [Mammaliicoccus vitulinus]